MGLNSLKLNFPSEAIVKTGEQQKLTEKPRGVPIHQKLPEKPRGVLIHQKLTEKPRGVLIHQKLPEKSRGVLIQQVKRRGPEEC